MKMDNIKTAGIASPLETNEKKAYDGLQALSMWKNDLGHRPFCLASCDDGQGPLTEAQGMAEVLAQLYASAREDTQRPSEITNISDSTIASALEGISRLLSLSRLEADSFEYCRRQGKGGQ